MREGSKLLYFPGALREQTTPGPHAAAVPQVLARLDNRLWTYFSHREKPENLPKNQYFALTAWIQAYGIEPEEASYTIEGDGGDVVASTTEYVIEINPFQPRPSQIVVAQYFFDDKPVGYGAFFMQEGTGTIQGIVADKFPGERAWIEGFVERVIDDGDDPKTELEDVLMNELAERPMVTRVAYTVALIDPIDPPSPPEGGEEIPLVA